MKEKEAKTHYHGEEKYNCLQAILKAFQKENSISDEEIDSYKSNGGGKVEGGICGAVYAAKIVNNSLEFAEQVDKSFVEKAGSIICKKIRKGKKLSCRDCVGLAAKELENYS